MFNPTKDNPIFWPIADLIAAYQRRELSPVEVLEDLVSRIEKLDPVFNTYLCTCYELARKQASRAEVAYRNGTAKALAGVPISIKDTFHIEGYPITYGSLVHRNDISSHDSGVVKRLRAAGAVFPGKTNTAEFGQSATTDNRLRDHCRNPWDVRRTTGGSSGGAASSVAAGLASVAIGADGGGSIRIPAGFTGLVGIKPTFGLCKDEQGFRAMTDFVCPGPLSRTVSDARTVLSVLADINYQRNSITKKLRIGWSSTLEGKPVDPVMLKVVESAVGRLKELGHEVVECAPPIQGWEEIFGPLVLNDEKVERLHLLRDQGDLLTEYELKTLQACLALEDHQVERARRLHSGFRSGIESYFRKVDLFVSPVTATTAFPLERRPTEIDGSRVDRLWGAFPFTSPFNVAGCPAASLPCGFVDGLPVGLQLVADFGAEALLLDIAEDLEQALNLDNSRLIKKWG